MPQTEFGILESVEYGRDYNDYEPEKYGCVAISDSYLDGWWARLAQMQTYFHNTNRPATALARYGVTLLAPQALPQLLAIVEQEAQCTADPQLTLLADKIREAIARQKFMIHFGV